VPAAWGAYVDQWKGEVKALKASYEGQPKPVVLAALHERRSELESTYSATVEDFLAWWELV
jgi:hypothetical protein